MNRTDRLSILTIPLLGLLLVAGISWLSAASVLSAQTPAPGDRTVSCAAGRSFLIRLDSKQAIVRVGDRTLVLHRRASPSMQHYSSSDAALIIDGDFVAFVMTDALNFNGCHLDIAAKRQDPPAEISER